MAMLDSIDYAAVSQDTFVIKRITAQLRALLAAPVVERQEPFAYSFRFAGCVTASGPEKWRDEIDREKPAQFLFDDGRVTNFQPLYTSPPAPVAVVLDENVEFEKWWCRTPVLRKGKLQIAQEAWEARARLDKVKELNQ